MPLDALTLPVIQFLLRRTRKNFRIRDKERLNLRNGAARAEGLPADVEIRFSYPKTAKSSCSVFEGFSVRLPLCFRFRPTVRFTSLGHFVLMPGAICCSGGLQLQDAVIS